MNQNTQTSERPRGRPVGTGQQDLKTQILDTAEKLFADHGYSATSMRRIADAVGVNPALIHYYFGSKKELLLKVMERSFEPLKDALAKMKDGAHASPGMIANLMLTMAASHPNIPRLLTREVLLPGGEMQEFFIDNMAPLLGGALPGLIEKEKVAGRMRQDADPSISAVLILAVCVFPFIARSLAEPVLGIKFDDDGIKFLNQQISALLREGMAR
jgi:AcrR family transcriptional regulator